MRAKFLSQKGMTLIELLIASLIVSIMVIFIGTFLINSFDNNAIVQSLSDLGDFSQKSVNRIKMEVGQSKRLFDNSVRGLGYWESLQFPEAQRPMLGTKLPEIIDQGSLSPSKLDDLQKPFVKDAVGNALFFAEHQGSLQANEEKRLIDLFRFVTYALVEKSQDQFSKEYPRYLDLIRCHSAPYADLSQVQDIQDVAERESILRQLQAKGVSMLWDTQAEAQVAFTTVDWYQPGKDPEVRHRIVMQSCLSAVPGLGRLGRAVGRVMYSVAFNQANDFPILRSVPLYARASKDEGSFPNGFEVAVVGPKSGRQILIRLVLAAPLRKQIVSRESFVIATVKDT